MNRAEIKITLTNDDGFDLDELARTVNLLWAALPATGRSIEIQGGTGDGPMSDFGGDLIAKRANELLDAEVRFAVT